MMRVACIVGGADSGDLAGSRCSAPSPSSSVYHADDERSRVRAVRVAIVQEYVAHNVLSNQKGHK